MLYHFCFTELELEKYVIIFNTYKDSFSSLVNMIILITKSFLYVKRCLQETPQFIKLINYIAQYKKIEYFASKKINCARQIQSKWQMYDMM